MRSWLCLRTVTCHLQCVRLRLQAQERNPGTIQNGAGRGSEHGSKESQELNNYVFEAGRDVRKMDKGTYDRLREAARCVFCDCYHDLLQQVHGFDKDRNKKITGKFKDECGMGVMMEFRGLRSKVYMFKYLDKKGVLHDKEIGRAHV